MLLFLAGFGFLITLYSFRYMAGKPRTKDYYAFLLVTIGSGCGVLLSNHLLNLYIKINFFFIIEILLIWIKKVKNDQSSINRGIW